MALESVTGPVAGPPLVVTEDGPRLVGSTCRACDTVTFPRRRSCPRCTGDDVEELLLANRGTLWTWTVQTFAPKPPYAGQESFESFGVGYVELPGQVRVEARLTEADPDKLAIGMAMVLTTIPLPGREADGAITYAFAPADGDEAR